MAFIYINYFNYHPPGHIISVYSTDINKYYMTLNWN